MKKRVMFYCQSLLGIGHFIRSRELLFALRDFEVCFLYGGEVVPGFDWPDWVEVVYLPALRSDTAFERLYVVGEQASLEEVKTRRKELLLATFDRFLPDILLIELFPFGRKKFNFELLPLLTRARASRPELKIICSVRDILVHRPAQEKYEAEVCQRVNQFFDALLIHSDPSVQRLEETFGSVAQLACPLYYTGYVAQPSQDSPPQITDQPMILVSIGGGRVGHELIDYALEASRLLPFPHQLQIFTGPHISDEEFQRLENKAAALSHARLQRHTTEFPTWLSRASLSISMAGYNTCMDILAAQARALVYPFNEHDNDEQTRRARKLEQVGHVTMLEPEQLSPKFLASEIVRLLNAPPPPPTLAIDLQGAKRTAELLAALLDSKSNEEARR
ncbi:MAG: glycosyl transferase [Acidobacteria bacterium]|nr:glycosyl transferase [Acidobacteriota bacterium]